MTFASMFRSDKEFITNCPVLVRPCETIRSFQSSLILFLSKTNNCRKSVRFIVWIHSYFYLLSIVRSAVKEWEFIRILADFSRSGQWRNSTTKIFHWDLGPLGLWGRKQWRLFKMWNQLQNFVFEDRLLPHIRADVNLCCHLVVK